LQLVKNKLIDILFKVAIAIGLAGIVMYLIQEISTSFIGAAYPIIMVIADFLGIFALIGLIVWLFIVDDHKPLVLNISILIGACSVFLFIFSHFFVTLYTGFSTGNILNDFIFSGTNFIALILLNILNIGVIVLFSLKLAKPAAEMPVYEKFTILLWLVALGIFDSTSSYWIRQNSAFSGVIGATLGISFLPVMLELLVLLFIAVLLIFKYFGKIKDDTLTIFTIFVMDVIFLIYAFVTVNFVGFNFSTASLIPAIIGNHFFMIGALMVLIMTFFLLREKFPGKKSTAKTT
jgi:hypothetical protein